MSWPVPKKAEALQIGQIVTMFWSTETTGRSEWSCRLPVSPQTSN